MGTKLHPFQLH